MLSRHGPARRDFEAPTSCSRADRATRHTCRFASTPESFTAGYAKSDSTVSCYGTHTMRRTKATLIYRQTKNLRAVQLLLGHSKLESTVRYLGIEVDDALEISEQTEA